MKTERMWTLKLFFYTGLYVQIFKNFRSYFINLIEYLIV